LVLGVQKGNNPVAIGDGVVRILGTEGNQKRGKEEEKRDDRPRSKSSEWLGDAREEFRQQEEKKNRKFLIERSL